VLSAEKNRQLCEVGPGTPMGELLRRYWMPIGGASEFDRRAIKRMKLLGEDLVLYKDRSGNFGLLARNCPHRRADLSYGYVEDVGLRCNYHGWLMDRDGSVIEQPYEDTTNPGLNFKAKCHTKAYPVREVAGLLFTYMGPDPAPELPVWEPFTWSNGFREIVITEVPCNWFQCQENSCDPVHFEWMHDNWGARLQGATDNPASKHLKLEFDEFDYGFTYRRVREGQPDGSELWTVGRVTLWPNGFYLGSHFEWRVPMDDENTLNICWFFARVPKERTYLQPRVPTWYGPTKDEKGRWITSHVINQDIIAWVGQGRIADRTQETLASSDRGIAMIRRRFFNEMVAVAAGRDPKGIIRDPDAAKCVPLPTVGLERNRGGVPASEISTDPWYSRRLTRFPWHAGQPQEVWDEYIAAMGVPAVRNDPIEVEAEA
jgi:5,5'-dehydrodivanillate O-demethylase